MSNGETTSWWIVVRGRTWRAAAGVGGEGCTARCVLNVTSRGTITNGRTENGGERDGERGKSCKLHDFVEKVVLCDHLFTYIRYIRGLT
jgi:hypothetical protein